METYITTLFRQWRQITMYGAVDVEPDNNLVRMAIHGVKNVRRLGKSINLPATVHFWNHHKIVRLLLQVEAGAEIIKPTLVVWGVESANNIAAH
jgi:hypothetical protein